MSVTSRLRDERGSVVVAVVALTLMLVLGFATYAAVNTQTRLSAVERVRESAFNLTEGALNAQTFVIGRLGPGSLSRTYPPQCPSVTEPLLCPDPARIADSYTPATQADYGGATTWTTRVRDNGGGFTSFYDANVESQPPWDANKDNQVWVRASAQVQGRTRTLVALVQVEARPVEFPRYSLTAGRFTTSNNGNKLIVNTAGSLGVAVRCAQPPESSCMDYEVDKGQVSPNNYELTYPNPSAISADDLAGLEELAQANGTYFTGCPPNPSGTVVVVESGNCSYNNSVPGACCNTAEAPGIFIVKNGTFSLNGNLEFRGIVYARNEQGTTGDVVTLGGTALIRGGVMVDGQGGISAGSSGLNLVYDPKPFDGARSFGTAGIVQNTWREITGSG